MSPSQEERLARVALGSLAEPADPRFAAVLAELGAVAMYEHLSRDVDLAGLRSQVAERLHGLDPAAILAHAEQLGIRFVVPGDAEWPEQLHDLDRIEPLNRMAGAPAGLWVKGPADLAAALRDSVAVVGSRSATTYGTKVAGDLAAHVAEQGATVVSGAAFGIDQAAHRGALAAGGTTVAVLACGVDRAYPTGHKALLDYIAEHGAVVADLRPGSSPTRHRFLSRNRLIAAMTRGTVVVEAAVRSGALNTASWANRMQRVVMGVPGPVHSAQSEGIHAEIHAGTMNLVTRGDQVRDLLAPVGEQMWAKRRATETAFDRLALVEQRVIEAVPLRSPAATASVAAAAGLSREETAATLLRLGEQGWVRGEADQWVRASVTLDV